MNVLFYCDDPVFFIPESVRLMLCNSLTRGGLELVDGNRLRQIWQEKYEGYKDLRSWNKKGMDAIVTCCIAAGKAVAENKDGQLFLTEFSIEASDGVTVLDVEQVCPTSIVMTAVKWVDSQIAAVKDDSAVEIPGKKGDYLRWLRSCRSQILDVSCILMEHKLWDWVVCLDLGNRIHGDLFGISGEVRHILAYASRGTEDEVNWLGEKLTSLAQEVYKKETGKEIDPFFAKGQRCAITAALLYMQECMPEKEHSLFALAEMFHLQGKCLTPLSDISHMSNSWVGETDPVYEPDDKDFEHVSVLNIMEYATAHKESRTAELWYMFSGFGGIHFCRLEDGSQGPQLLISRQTAEIEMIYKELTMLVKYCWKHTGKLESCLV